MSYDGPNPNSVPAGGTGNASVTAFALLAGGTTTTGAFQSITNGATASTVLIGNGVGALASFSATPRVTGLGIGATSTGTGLTFDGSNTLSNFAQGTFSPTITGSTSNPTTTYTSQVGRYQRVGRMVNFMYRVAYTAQTGGSGTMQLDSLPFTTANNTGAVYSHAATLALSQTSVLPATDTYFSCFTNINVTFITPRGSSIAGGSGTYTVSSTATTGDFAIAGAFEV